MRRVVVALILLSGAMTSCGDGGSSADGGEERSVLVDFRHDEFAGAFLQYYPEHLQIRPGDTVQFRQAWTGEPHSVTFGKVVDDVVELLDRMSRYESVEDAVAAGETMADIERFVESYGKLSAMTQEFTPTASGAQPCYVDDMEDAPVVRDIDTDEVDPDVPCPTKGRRQPAFTGRQALYNSGFIPYSGARGNSFTMPIADDATPGTYAYFCNYHFIFMGGTVEVVEAGTAIPSQSEVSRQARKEIEADADQALAKVKAAARLGVGDTIEETVIGPAGEVDLEVTLPLSGRSLDNAIDTLVIINEFFPRKFEVGVGEKVTWTLDGSLHTVSFNVPKYFPIFTVDEGDGEVHWDPRAYEPRGFDIDRGRLPAYGEDAEPAHLDAGAWDGRGGFHSSGALVPGDTFSVTFTKPGTYPFACVLHPQMVGTLEVTA
jgi:plastocyanin